MKKRTLYTKIIESLKNNRIIVILIILFIVLSGIIGLTNQAISLYKYIKNDTQEKAIKPISKSDSVNRTREDTMTVKSNHDLKKVKKSFIGGHLLDSSNKPIVGGEIIIEGISKVKTDNNGMFYIEFNSIEQQVKVKVTYSISNIGKNSRWVSINQKNIVLRL